MDKNILKIIGIFLGIIIVVLLITNKPAKSTTMYTQTPTPITNKGPKMIIDSKKTYTATVETSEGTIEIKLNADSTPITVNNFVYLAKKDFYNNTIFHRVIKSFMIQGGDPKGDGTGGPGYSFDDEKFDGNYDKGILAMANAGPNTNGSQFFIMLEKNDLPKNYVIFGKVISGLDVVEKIGNMPVEISDSGEMSRLVNPVTVKSVTITEN